MQSPVTPKANPQSKAALVALAGCALAILGAFLDWWTVSGQIIAGGERTEPGTNWDSGSGTLYFAIIVAVVVTIMWFRAPTSGGRGFAIAAFVLGLFVFGAATYSALAPESAVQTFEASSLAEETGVSETVAEAQIETAVDNEQLKVDAEIGTYVATAGGVLLELGALLGIIAGTRAKKTAMAPGQPEGVYVSPPPGAEDPSGKLQNSQ